MSFAIILFAIVGYAALFKHPNEELNFCVYLIPGNPKVVPEDLPKWHDYMLKDPSISKALGNNFKIERMRAGNVYIVLLFVHCTYEIK